MAAKYKFFRNTRSVLKENHETFLSPRIVQNRIIRLDDISKRIVSDSTFTNADVLGVWQAIKREIQEALADGNRVELEGLGVFNVILTCREESNPKKIRAESIRFSKVAYHPSQKLHRRLKNMELERVADGPVQQAWSPDERQERILAFLEQHEMIKSSVVMLLNACSRYTAQKDIKKLFEAGKLIQHGGPNVAIYSLNQDEEAG